MSDTELIRDFELAEWLNVKRSTLSRWRLRGWGPPFIKVGKCVRYKVSDVKEYLEKRKRQSTKDR